MKKELKFWMAVLIGGVAVATNTVHIALLSYFGLQAFLLMLMAIAVFLLSIVRYKWYKEWFELYQNAASAEEKEYHREFFLNRYSDMEVSEMPRKLRKKVENMHKCVLQA